MRGLFKSRPCDRASFRLTPSYLAEQSKTTQIFHCSLWKIPFPVFSLMILAPFRLDSHRYDSWPKHYKWIFSVERANNSPLVLHFLTIKPLSSAIPNSDLEQYRYTIIWFHFWESVWIYDTIIQKSSVAVCGYKWFLFCFLLT